MIKLFVYGTLLTGERNWSWALNPQVGISDYLHGAVLYNLGAFPGIKLSDNEDDIVIGEVFEITEEQLKRIDRLEGYFPKNPQSLYTRVSLVLESDTPAYTYVYNGTIEPFKRIESGNWRDLG